MVLKNLPALVLNKIFDYEKDIYWKAVYDNCMNNMKSYHKYREKYLLSNINDYILDGYFTLYEKPVEDITVTYNSVKDYYEVFFGESGDNPEYPFNVYIFDEEERKIRIDLHIPEIICYLDFEFLHDYCYPYVSLKMLKTLMMAHDSESVLNCISDYSSLLSDIERGVGAGELLGIGYVEAEIEIDGWYIYFVN